MAFLIYGIIRTHFLKLLHAVMNKLKDSYTHFWKSIIYDDSKRPVTPSGVSTALARCSLIFRSTVRAQAIFDVFLEKAPVTASSRRPHSDQGVATELL